MEKEEKEKILGAGQIAKQVREWIKPQIKKGVPLLETAEKIESKIIELGGKPAFPVNLSINEVSAHYTPSHNDETLAHGLLKVDFGVHIDGWAADNAFSIDLENDEENKNLISASEKALEQAIKTVKEKISKGESVLTNQIGEVIQKEIESLSFNPVVNLSGHSMERYDLHAGITIPNIGGQEGKKLEEGFYAIEPFATNGNGKVKDKNPSGIYHLKDERTPRSPSAREVLNFIKNEYNTLPFCSRWIVKKFGNKSLLALRELERNGNLHHFDQLVEISEGKVAQFEHTILIDSEKNEIIVTTL